MTIDLGGRRRPVEAGLALACMLAVAASGGCASDGARASRTEPGASPSAPYRDPASLRRGDIAHVATGRLLTEPELLDHLAHLPVVYVGEVHDSAEDHRVQLAVLRGLHERAGGPLALGLEMLARTRQADADAFIRGEMDEPAFRRIWTESWGAWEPYAEILRFARAERIPLLALGTEKALTEAVRRHGVTGLPAGLAERAPAIDLEDPHHRAYVQAIFAGHGRGAMDFEQFYRVQTLWDETMADTAARFLRRAGAGARLLVLAGTGHVRYGFGVPRRLFRRLPVPYAIVLPVQVEVGQAKRERQMDVSPPSPPLPAGDFYWAVRYE